MKRPFEIYILGFLMLFLSVGAIYGGGSLVAAPDGSLLKMEELWLDKLPFPDFLSSRDYTPPLPRDFPPGWIDWALFQKRKPDVEFSKYLQR